METTETINLEEYNEEEKEVYGPDALPIYNEEKPVIGTEFYVDEVNSEESNETAEEITEE